MSYRNRSAIQNFVVYHLIFFFILTPFLASCGGGSSSDSNTPTALTEEQIVANAVEDQNRSAMTAIAQTVEMLTVIDNARSLIEDTFDTLNPTAADIQAYVENNSEEATNLLAQLDTGLENVEQTADSLVATIDEMEDAEATISSGFSDTGSTTAELHREAQDVFTLIGILGALTVIGLFAAVGKAVSDQVHSIRDDDDSEEDDDSEDDPSGDYEILSKVTALEDSVRNWDDIGEEAGKATATTAATSAVSSAAGTQEYKKLKFAVDAYGAYDTGRSIGEGAVGIRDCRVSNNSQPQSLSIPFRTSAAIEYDSLTAEDIYVGTPDAGGTFHNVPPGEWVFVVFVDGHLRTVTGCINAGVDEPDTIEAEITAVPLEAIGDLLSDSPDEIIACSDINECEDGYICYLGFCEPESEFPMGSSDYVGHWRIIAENTTSNYWVADTLMMDTGRFNLQIYLWGTELGSVQRGIWSYNTRYNTLTLVDDNGSEIISGPINWENQNTDFWQTGTWAGSTEQKRYAWLKQDDEDDEDDCPCDGPTCPTRCPD